MSAPGLSLLSLLFLYNLFLLPCVNAALSNRTIDDQRGDSVLGIAHAPTYSLGFSAHTGNCTGCSSVPVDYTKAFEGTWHDGTHTASGPPLTISASFSGVAVYVFNIIANDVRGVFSVTDLALVVDGQTVDHFSNQASNSTLPPNEMLYQVPVLTATNLPNGQHSLQIVADGDTNSLVLFDYIEYTFDDEVGGGTASPSFISSSTMPSFSLSTSSSATSPSTKDSILTPTTPAAISSLGDSISGILPSSTTNTSSSKLNNMETGSITPTSSPGLPSGLSTFTSAHNTSAIPGSPTSASFHTTHHELVTIAGSVGGASVAVISLLVFCWCRRRRARARKPALYLDKNDQFVSLGADSYLLHEPSPISRSARMLARMSTPGSGLVGTDVENARARESQGVRAYPDLAAAEEQMRTLEARVRTLEKRLQANAVDGQSTQPPTGGAIFDALAVAAEQARVRNEIAVLRDEIEQNHRCQRESLPEYSG